MPTAFEQLEETINAELRQVETQLLEILPEVLLPIISVYIEREDSFWEEQFNIFFPSKLQEVFRIKEEALSEEMNRLFIEDTPARTIYERLNRAALAEANGDSTKVLFKKQYDLWLLAAQRRMIYSESFEDHISPNLQSDKTFALASAGCYRQFNQNLLADREIAWSVLTNFCGGSESVEKIFPRLSQRERNNKKFWFDVIKICPHAGIFLGHITTVKDDAFLLAVSPAIQGWMDCIVLPTIHPSLTGICQHYQNNKVLAQAANYNNSPFYFLLMHSFLITTAALFGVLILASVVTAPLSVGIVLTTSAALAACGLFGKTVQHQRAVYALQAEAKRRFIDNTSDEDPGNGPALVHALGQ